jgi:hypothetical protein
MALMPASLERAAFGSTIITGLALVGLCASLVLTFEVDSDLSEKSMQTDLSDAVYAISTRTLAMLGLSVLTFKLMLFPEATLDVSHVLLSGGAKAIHWIVLFWMVSSLYPCVAGQLLTISGARAALGNCT